MATKDTVSTMLHTSLQENIQLFHRLLPLDSSFDFITRSITLGSSHCYFISINGMCDLDIMQRLFSDIEAESFQVLSQKHKNRLPDFVKDQFFYAQISFLTSVEEMIHGILSGPSLLLIDGYTQGLLIDTRKYPSRSLDEPDTEKVLQGAKDGFVETLLTNCNLLRRRLRTPNLIFSLHTIGTLSKTDVAVSYLKQACDQRLLEEIQKKLNSINTSCLTMGIQSLKELMVKKSIFHPMPDFFLTSRPDVAASYLAEGYILILVDNSPFAMILPCNVFQFIQNPEDYYKAPLVGTYQRLIRFFCLINSLFLMPLVLYFSYHREYLTDILQQLLPKEASFAAIFIYILFIELGLDLFKYASSHSANGYSSSLAIVGGLLIGDVAIRLSWTSDEIIFYGAATLLSSFAISNIPLSDAIKIYRLFLLFMIACFPKYGLWIGIFFLFLSLFTTPVFGKKSYFWPLFPFSAKDLMMLLFRTPTFRAQPEIPGKTFLSSSHSKRK